VTTTAEQTVAHADIASACSSEEGLSTGAELVALEEEDDEDEDDADAESERPVPHSLPIARPGASASRHHLRAHLASSKEDDPLAAFASSSVVSASRRHHPTWQVPVDKINEKAVSVMRRVHTKLTGRDFAGAAAAPLDVGTQVDRLIEAATSKENLCQCYVGWCPFW
jgi:hypothetical protein